MAVFFLLFSPAITGCIVAAIAVAFRHIFGS
jgi:hypothetical protein